MARRVSTATVLLFVALATVCAATVLDEKKSAPTVITVRHNLTRRSLTHLLTLLVYFDTARANVLALLLRPTHVTRAL